MTHLGERITDYIFGEMSASETSEARRHVGECTECRERVRQFERTHMALKASPAVEPPRRIVLEVEKRPAPAWRWLAPLAAAAAIVVAVLIAAPMSIQWGDSQLTIAFGKAITPATRPEAVNGTVPAATIQSIDYERIVREVQSRLDRPQEAALVTDLSRRDADRVKTILRLQDRLVYLENAQQSVEKQNLENAATIAVLAQRSDSQE